MNCSVKKTHIRRGGVKKTQLTETEEAEQALNALMYKKTSEEYIRREKVKIRREKSKYRSKSLRFQKTEAVVKAMEIIASISMELPESNLKNKLESIIHTLLFPYHFPQSAPRNMLSSRDTSEAQYIIDNFNPNTN